MWVEPDPGLPPAEGFLRVEVLNTGQRSVLAWGVTFTVSCPDGTTDRRGLGLDTAAVLPENRTGSVAPGRTVHNTGGGSFVATDCVMSDGIVTFVIYDDDTALGDERDIAYHFAHRRTNQMFWQKMQTILDDATSHNTDPAAILSGIRQGMEAESDPNFREGFWYKEILARMSDSRMERAGATPDGVLDNLRTTIAAQKANADAHATRR